MTLPTNPTAEVDIYGGFRFTRARSPSTSAACTTGIRASGSTTTASSPGAPFPSYPNGNATLKQTDFWEVYGKLGWEVIKDKFAVGANVYYSPDWLNTGADGLFASVTAKVTLPSFRLGVGMVDEVGWYISGEAGYYWLGTTDAYPGVFAARASICPTMRPGTSASPSPGRSRPSICATTTPTCRRRTATS